MAASPTLHHANVESQSDFRAAIERAEAAAEAYVEPVQETPAEGEATEPLATPEVAAPVAPEVTEPPTEAATPETPAAPDDPTAARLAALEAQIAERDARIAEQESFIGRQTTEVGTVRQQIEELRARVEAPPAAPPAPVVQITQDLIDENPAYAVQLAFEQGNQQALGAAYENWKLEDPATAGVWLAEKRFDMKLAERDAAHAQEMEQIKAAVQPAQERVQQDADQAAWAQAFEIANTAHPDFVANAERLLTDVAPRYPHLVTILSQGEPAARAEALTVLYQIDAATRNDPEAVRAQLEAQAAAAAQEAATSAAAAGVVTGQTTSSALGAPERELTYEEQEKAKQMARNRGSREAWDAQMKNLTSPRT